MGLFPAFVPPTLLLARELFVREPATASPGTGSGLLADHDRLKGFEHQTAQQIAACLQVSGLLPMDLAMDLQQTLIGDPRSGKCLQASQRRRVERLGLIQIPDQGRLGVDFIDILSPWPAASGINRLQFASGNR